VGGPASSDELGAVQGRDLGVGFRVQGSGFRVQGSGFRVSGLKLRVQGRGIRVWGLGQDLTERCRHLRHRHPLRTRVNVLSTSDYISQLVS